MVDSSNSAECIVVVDVLIILVLLVLLFISVMLGCKKKKEKVGSTIFLL